MKTIGSVLKDLRKEKQLTQKELAEGVCAQSMLSGIENDVYIPNANLLIELANKLKVDLNTISLETNYDISTNKDFNTTVEKLCNHHEYSQLLTFLSDGDVGSQPMTQFQQQSYYYYLGVAQFQTNSIDSALNSLKLSLAETNDDHLSTLSRLAYMSMGYIYAKQRKNALATSKIDLAFKGLNDSFYEENQNILYYLAALIYFELNDLEQSKILLTASIEFISRNNSHYMLANCYFLLARLAQQLGQDSEQRAAEERKNIFQELYNEHVFKNI